MGRKFVSLISSLSELGLPSPLTWSVGTFRSLINYTWFSWLMILGMVRVWSSVLCARRMKLIMIAGRNYVVEIFVLKMPIKAELFSSISGLMWKVIISILTKAQNAVLECHPPTSIIPIPTMSFPKKGRVRKVRISFVSCRFPTTTNLCIGTRKSFEESGMNHCRRGEKGKKILKIAFYHVHKWLEILTEFPDISIWSIKWERS